MKFGYKITKFDQEQKLLVVVFDDDSWADIRLANPLPRNMEELEAIIKTFVAPKEAIEAQLTPDADISFIGDFVNVDREADRLVLNPDAPENQITKGEIDDEIQPWEEMQFNKRIGDILVEFGVLKENPLSIPFSI